MDGRYSGMTKQVYSFAEERFADLDYDEVMPLLEEHWMEVSFDKEIPLNPDLEKYLLLEEAGHLHCLSCRDEEGTLVGYVVTFLTPHVHYKDTLYAENDLIYIHPNHRKGTLGIRMLRRFEEIMKERGVDVLHMHVKISIDFGKVLQRLGYHHEENVYRKKIGN